MPRSVVEALEGAFIRDSTNTRRFDGGTSYSAFQSKISSALSSIPSKSSIQSKLTFLHQQTSLSSCDDAVPISPKVPVQLPDRRALEQASEVFFAEINCIIYVLNQDRFFSSFDRIYDLQGPHQASTLATVHLIIALAQGSSESFETACLQTDAIIEEGTQESVEAFMLMRMIASPFTPPGYALASAMLSKILRRVLQCLCKEGPGQADIQPQLNTLFDEMQSWWAELPTHLHDCSTVAPSLLRTTLHLQLRYHYIVCLIARPYLFFLAFEQKFADEMVLKWAELGERANQNSIRILKTLQISGHLSSSFWLDVHHVLCAGLILLLRVLKNPALPSCLQEVYDFLPTLRITSHTRIGQFAVECFEMLEQNVQDGNEQR
ncbi:hypothetical protein SLS60_004411 [Paraconiothyrium brasiliense]|uniref:Uncharacterized protein n=1 Tax=Paraconiothyrium brasiliense TaxID=300254 RepID=A0ABR3RKA0_9PLEO